MITFRVFDDSVAAALAKTVLDDHDIPCNLADENSHAYNVGFVAPIRLLIPEDYIEEASRLLDSPDHPLPDGFGTNVN